MEEGGGGECFYRMRLISRERMGMSTQSYGILTTINTFYEDVILKVTEAVIAKEAKDRFDRVISSLLKISIS